MKLRHLLLLLAIVIGSLLEVLGQVPRDSELYQTVMALDKAYFDAYNTCDLKTQASLLDDELEFYHDQGGLSTDKEGIIESIRQNICGKVQRQLLEESVEIHEIKGFGAAMIGLHTFFNREEPDATPKPGRFVTLWKQAGGQWRMYRVVSLH